MLDAILSWRFGGRAFGAAFAAISVRFRACDGIRRFRLFRVLRCGRRSAACGARLRIARLLVIGLASAGRGRGIGVASFAAESFGDSDVTRRGTLPVGISRGADALRGARGRWRQSALLAVVVEILVVVIRRAAHPDRHPAAAAAPARGS